MCLSGALHFTHVSGFEPDVNPVVSCGTVVVFFRQLSKNEPIDCFSVLEFFFESVRPSVCLSVPSVFCVVFLFVCVSVFV